MNNSPPAWSRISTDVDYDKAGKQVSFLAVPNSTNESAYGTVTIPIAVLKNGAGPTMLLTGGVHGDEYEGPVTLMKLARQLNAEQIQGRIIIIPCLNLPALMAGDRCSPIDGLNLNRVFPGHWDGTITQMIAHYVCDVLLPMIDIQMDMHSGGKTLEYIPSVNMKACEDMARRQRTFDAIQAFGAPIALIDQNLDYTGILNTVFEQHGILNLDTELGGAGRVDPGTLAIAETGVTNLLKHFDMLEGDLVVPQQQGREPSRLTEILDLDCYVMCPDDGLYEPLIELREDVVQGQPIGQVHYPNNLDREPWVTHAPRGGFLLCKRPPGRVQRGDAPGEVGDELGALRLGAS